MLFSSISFLYYFLPLVLLMYYLSPGKLKNLVLLLCSLLFYGWGEGRYLLLMASLILTGHGFACLIQYSREKGRKGWDRLFLFLGLGVNLALLGYFKYADFLISNVNRITGLQLPLLKTVLPLGISFYTFQLMSYMVDVYRREVRARKNPLYMAAYVAMFPQLVAGPIVRYVDIDRQLESRKLSSVQIARGIRRFVLGLGKKVLLANALGEVCAIFRKADTQDMLFCWMYAIFFMLQIYFDFSGYSDMAIGLGKMLGFVFKENFRYPYAAKSITDFWRRWHISLGSWFRDYVYIPLGGNRVGVGRWLFNLVLVWFLTGFWHGASWNFILWGLYFAFFLVLEKLWLGEKIKKSRLFSHLYVLLVVMTGFLIFDAVTLSEAGRHIRGLFWLGQEGWTSVESLYYLRSYFVTAVIAVLGATPVPRELLKRLEKHSAGKKFLAAAEPPALAALFLLATACLVEGSFNPFLYFRF